jgi:AcrR family transcriptional regulator
MTHEERHGAILDAALRLFSERGFRGTTTRALAEAVGVTEPVLYEHFRSKRDLYAAIVEAKSAQGMARAHAILEPLGQARDDRGLFQKLGEFILDCLLEDEGYARLLLSAAVEDRELGSIFYQRQRQGRERLRDYIALRISEGAFRPVDPAVAARSFAGMMQYHAMTCLLYGDDFVKLPRQQVIEQMVDLFLRGIRA